MIRDDSELGWIGPEWKNRKEMRRVSWETSPWIMLSTFFMMSRSSWKSLIWLKILLDLKQPKWFFSNNRISEAQPASAVNGYEWCHVLVQEQQVEALALLSSVAQFGRYVSAAETKTATDSETCLSSSDCHDSRSGWTQMHADKALEIHIAAPTNPIQFCFECPQVSYDTHKSHSILIEWYENIHEITWNTVQCSTLLKHSLLKEKEAT